MSDPKTLIKVLVERLAPGGGGVGRVVEGFMSGKVTFVPYTAPEEVVLATVEAEKKNYLIAKLVEVLTPSEYRVKPVCRIFGECGGCTWQHISYDEQIRQKQSILRWTFRDFQPELLEFREATNPWGYRRRVQLHRRGNQIGFLKRNSHQIVETSECPIARNELVKQWPNKKTAPKSEKFELGLTDEGEVYCTTLREKPEFSQVNSQQNQYLRTLVADWCGDEASDKVFDLYCGSGNLTFAISLKFGGQIIGVDSDERLIGKAKNKNKERRISFLTVSDMNWAHLIFDNSTVVLDPPRTGCSEELIQTLLRHKPKQIVYVSCNPQTAKRDIQKLTPTMKLLKVQGLDMFPQTDHIEMVGLLR